VSRGKSSQNDNFYTLRNHPLKKQSHHTLRIILNFVLTAAPISHMVPNFAALKDDGSTLSLNWLYAGGYTEEELGKKENKSKQRDLSQNYLEFFAKFTAPLRAATLKVYGNAGSNLCSVDRWTSMAPWILPHLWFLRRHCRPCG